MASNTNRPDDFPASAGGGHFIGEIDEIVKFLISDGVVTEDQAVRAQKIRAKLDTPRRLLEVLQELGYANEEKVRAALINNRAKIRLGSLLVELGYISDKQLEVALGKQKLGETRMRLGEVLVANKYISENELARVLAIHLGFPYVEPSIADMDKSLLTPSVLKDLKNLKILPLSQKDGKIQLAMVDPLDQKAIGAAGKLFGKEILPHISNKKLLEEIIEAVAGGYPQVKEAVHVDPAAAVDIVDDIIKQAIEKGVSDIHIEPMRKRIRVRFRKDGSLIDHADIPKELEPAVVNRLKVLSEVDITERRRHQGGRFVIASDKYGTEVDLRVSFYVSFYGETVVMRLLAKKNELLKVTDIGMTPKILDRFREEVLDVPTGVVIVTGPTGSGKTTSLYAAINYSNRPDTKIITAEDPVEYVIDGVTQCTINPKLGITFEETLKHILRQDPDVIVLGEIRDRYSAESAIQAALTGHKVLTTFHTEDTIGGLLRLMNMDIETFLISSTVVSVVAQRLIKKICPHCKEPYEPSPRDFRRLKYTAHDLKHYNFQLGSGCEHCDYTGYNGRIGVFELLVLNEAVKEAILAQKPSSRIRRICLDTTGLVTLVEDGLIKAAKGVTSIQEVIRMLPILEHPRPLDQLMRLAGGFQ